MRSVTLFLLRYSSLEAWLRVSDVLLLLPSIVITKETMEKEALFD